jgi:hypothetical protein
VTLGPAHFHRAVDRPADLLDLGRTAAGATTAHVLSAFGHFHALSSTERHHHAFGDASVVRTGDDAALDPDRNPVSPALTAFVALLPDGMPWPAPLGHAVMVPHGSWACVTHVPEGLERPPRAS